MIDQSASEMMMPLYLATVKIVIPHCIKTSGFHIPNSYYAVHLNIANIVVEYSNTLIY